MPVWFHLLPKIVIAPSNIAAKNEDGNRHGKFYGYIQSRTVKNTK